MRIELLTTGSELLLGFTVNTHATYLARQLASLGLRFDRQTTTSDERPELRAALAEALGRSDVLLVTGGLGPTSDDCTRDIAAELLGWPLQRDERIAARIADRFRRRGIPMPESVLVQALVPAGATVLFNDHGTAPGLVLEPPGKLLVLLPGPPRELKPMLEQQVLPLLRQRASAATPLDCRVFRVVGLGESQVEEQVAPALAGLPGIELGYCARLGEVEVRIIAAARADGDEAERRIRAALGVAVFGTEADRLEDVVVRLLAARRRTLVTAESCTGGLTAHRLTNVSGASQVFLGGWVTYANEAKVRDLGVSEATLQAHGAVSEQTAREMAEGARARAGADLAVSITGIAGPTGGTPDKPVGLVYLGLATGRGTHVERRSLAFDRETFKFFASQTALDLVRRELLQP